MLQFNLGINVQLFGRAVLSVTVALSVAGCSLPRGAAIQSEVVSESRVEEPSFQVVKVTRNDIPALSRWPVTGWTGHYHWFSDSRGPDSSVIQTGDTLQIVVWDNQENSLLAGDGTKLTEMPPMTVSSSGKIFMPYVGDVSVRGLTQDAARDRLQERLEAIASSAQVQLAVVEGRNNSVDVVGGVGAPGRVGLESRNTGILSVIAQSGGIKDELRNPLVRLQRGGKTYDILARDLLADADSNVRVRGGDQITIVEDERSFNVLGAAGSQQLLYFEKETMSVMEALSAMGGLEANRANPEGVLILRDYDAGDLTPGMDGPDMQQVVFTLDLTSADGLFAARQFDIHPGDTILATESPVNAVRTILGLLGNVVGFGNTVSNI